MKPLSTTDEATTRTWQWLHSNIKNALLLTFCRAILERDEAALKAACAEHFVGEYDRCQTLSLECNRELASLELGEALRTGYAHTRGGSRNRTGFILLCDMRKTILYAMNDHDKDIVVLTGQVRQEQELAAITLDSLKQALVQAVETRLSMC